MKGTSKKVIALLTAFVLCFGILLPAAHTLIPSSEQNLFPAPEQNDNAVYEPQSPVASDKYYSRDALEEIAVILGGNNVQDMSQSELQEFVEDKLDAPLPTVGQDNAAVEELVQKDDIREPIADPAAKQENEAASPEQTDYEEKKDAFNEDGEIVKPFDEVFPEYMETEAVEYDEETVLIRLSVDSDGKVTSAMKKAGVAKLEKMFATEESVWYEAFLKKGTDIREAVTALRAIDEIELVEYNFTIRTTAMDDYEELEANVTSNKLVAHQWHLNYCGFRKGSKLLDNAGGDPSVIVAVIDTGVDYNHEDLHDNIRVNEKEIPDNGMDDDDNGYVDDYYGINIITGSGNGENDNGVAPERAIFTGARLRLSDNTDCTVVVLGDVDCDGLVTASDARLALRASVRLENFPTDSAQYKAANVSSEDPVSAGDARSILRVSVKLDDPQSWLQSLPIG